jgi:transposase
MYLNKKEEFSTTHIGHLGLVAAKIADIGLVDLINQRLPISEARGAKISHGERVAAMIMNGLGFIDSRLYLFPEFLSDKPLERLFGRHVEAAWFNDDATGRCLDEIAAFGSTKLFTELAMTIGQERGLLGKSVHIDTTTLSLFGDYDDPEQDKGTGKADSVSPRPALGYAKSGRHDLKQMVLLLATTGASGFPMWMESHSGNASDQVTMPGAAVKMKQICQGLAGAPEFIHVGDSAIYANILEHSDDIFWITRVPEKMSEVRTLVSTPDEKIEWIELDNGYSYYPTTSHYKGVDQRWVLFFSDAAWHRENATLDKKIKKEGDVQDKAWWHLGNHLFTCSQDAFDHAMEHKKNLKFHEVSFTVEEVKKHTSKGRPKQGELPETVGYQIKYTLSLDAQKIAEMRTRKGRFVLATNQLDEAILPNEEVLREYKGQSGVERGFKFIKDDTFQVDSVFLKTPQRIDALMMVMTLCLMVYGISEYELRKSLQEKKQTIPSQTKKPTDKPSLRWVFFLFRVVNELSVTRDGLVKKMVLNLDGTLRKIIKLFGPRAETIYLNTA